MGGNMIETRRRIIASAPHIVTPTAGNPVSFAGNMVAPLKKCVVDFVPVQAGTGDPSPENVRPITGWTGLNVMRAGKNLFDKAYLTNTGAYKNLANGYFYTDKIMLAPNTQYIIKPTSTEQLNTSRYYVIYINPSDTNPDYLVITNPVVTYPVFAGKPQAIVFTTGNTGTIRFGVASVNVGMGYEPDEDSLLNFMSIDWQLELGSTATSYAPYTGTTYPVTFPAEAGTVYGGTVDLVTGVLTVTHGFTNMKDKTWYSGYGGYYSIVPEMKRFVSTEMPNLICTKYPTIKFNDVGSNDKVISCLNNERFVYVKNTSITSVEAMETEMQDACIAYELGTPITYQLTPQQIKTLIGTNNVWSDANGNINLQYWAH